MNECICPACKGTGKLPPPKEKVKQDPDGRMAHAASALKEKGYTVREIAAILGYKNPGSISHLLGKSTK